MTTTRRRAKGTGSVRERSKGRWEVRFDGPPDAAGERPKVYETVRGSRRDAERTLRERLGVVDSGSYVPKSAETVAAFMGRWLDTYAATNTTIRTQQGYRHYVESHIKPALGAIVTQNLSAAQIQGLYASMLARGLAPRTVLHCHRVLRGALGHAVKWGELIRNPTDAVTPPKVEKPELQTWDPDIFHSFMEHAKDSPFRDLYYFAVLTGLRRSELCGLKWKDVDLGTSTMRVARTLQRIKGRGLVEGQPKTQRSRRTIELSQGATELLSRVRIAQLERKLACGDAWRGHGHVFNGVDGAPISGERPSRDFAAIVRSASLPHLTLHGLRHTAAALLIAGGVHARAIADIMGHSSIATTMDTYGHLMRGVQGEAVSIIDESLAAVRSA